MKSERIIHSHETSQVSQNVKENTEKADSKAFK